MVHALEQVRRLLQPDGRLIDIHPTPDPPPIEVHIGQHTTCVGWLRETDDFIEYSQADAALAQAVQHGLFVVEREGEFPYVTYAGSVAELRAYLADEWKDAILDEATAARAEELLNVAEHDKELILRERIRITRLRPARA